jgi:hypothetical protein
LGNLPAIKQSYRPPAELAFLSSEASVLDTESYADYKSLSDRMIYALKPVDIIDWIHAKDFVDITWEIRRERLTKAELMRRGQAASMRAAAGRRKDDHLASAFIGSFKYIDAIDRRIAQLEVRRGNILAEMQRYNDRMAQRLAAAVDVEDAEYSELAAE